MKFEGFVVFGSHLRRKFAWNHLDSLSSYGPYGTKYCSSLPFAFSWSIWMLARHKENGENLESYICVTATRWIKENQIVGGLVDYVENSFWIVILICCCIDGTVRHYEVVYLIHEKHDEEVENVNSKVQGTPVFPLSVLSTFVFLNIFTFAWLVVLILFFHFYLWSVIGIKKKSSKYIQILIYRCL